MERKTIIKLDNVEKTYTIGEDIEVHAVRGISMEVKKGDTVLYGKYAGTELTIDGKDYLIMRQSDILAII